jgi:hypothetical protein
MPYNDHYGTSFGSDTYDGYGQSLTDRKRRFDPIDIKKQEKKPAEPVAEDNFLDKPEFYWVLGVPIEKKRRPKISQTPMPAVVQESDRSGLSSFFRSVITVRKKIDPTKLPSVYPTHGYIYSESFVSLVTQRNILLDALTVLDISGLKQEYVVAHLNKLLDSVYAMLVTLTQMQKLCKSDEDSVKSIKDTILKLHEQITLTKDTTIKVILTDTANAKTHELLDIQEICVHDQRVKARLLKIASLLSHATSRAAKCGINKNDKLLTAFKESLDLLFSQMDIASYAQEEYDRLLPAGETGEESIEEEANSELPFYLQYQNLWGATHI